MPQTISFDDIEKHLISATDLRRKTGSYLNMLSQGQSFVILRGNTPIGTLNPLPQKTKQNSRQDDIEKIRRLAGGFHFRKSLSPKQLDEAYDKMYDEMLPR